jgi:hypothetical protein
MVAELKTSKWKQCGQRKVKSKLFFSEPNILMTKVKICKQAARTQTFEICTEACMYLRLNTKQEVTW